MSDSSAKLSKKTGSCLCKKVSITAGSVSPKVGVCHCGMCRKRTGGPLLAVDCGTDVMFSGEENIARYSSSAWAERGFCKSCGTNLFYFLKPKKQYIIPCGIFDDDNDFTLHHEIFIDDKPAYYDFRNDTIRMTGAEVFAKSSK
jgi:hypothetical protein